LNYATKSDCKEFIVATEAGIIHQMQKANPDKSFIPAPPNNSCACNDCPHMKLNTLEKLYNCLKYEQPEVILSADLIEKAKKPIIKMLDLSKKFGL
jgi:quinolinate synthase